MERRLLKNRTKTGIYFLLKRKKVVYIGQTISFPKRLSGHCAKDFDSVRFIECSEENLTKYEDRWIRLFKPKLNIKNAKANDGKPYILRLPMNLYNEVFKRAESAELLEKEKEQIVKAYNNGCIPEPYLKFWHGVHYYGEMYNETDTLIAKLE